MAPLTLTYKSLSSWPGAYKVANAGQGIVEAWVNTTGLIDLSDDVMRVGCWRGVIDLMVAGQRDRPSTCWGHDHLMTTGKVLDAEEVAPGNSRLPDRILAAGGGALWIRAQYNLDTQRGREAFSDVSFGAIRQWSVGFMPDESSIDWKGGTRFVGNVLEWPEVSNVLVGSSPNTATASVKAALSAGGRRSGHIALPGRAQAPPPPRLAPPAEEPCTCRRCRRLVEV